MNNAQYFLTWHKLLPKFLIRWNVGRYDSFADFLIVLILISTLSVRWITANLAGLTIRFIRKKKEMKIMKFQHL